MSQQRPKADDILARCRAFLHGNPQFSDAWPQDIEAEKAILACLLLDPITTASIMQSRGVSHGFLYLPQHQIICAAIIGLINAGVAVDFITIAGKLRDEKQLEGVGGPAYLNELYVMLPSAGNLEHYLTRIIDHYGLRWWAESCISEAALALENHADFKQRVVDGQRMCIKLAQIGTKAAEVTIKEQVEKVLKKRAADNGERIQGLSTHIPAMDSFTGGICGGHLVMIAGRGKNKKSSGSGKTTYATDIFRHMLHQHRLPALFLEMEMASEDLICRMVSGWSEIPLQHIRQKRLSDANETAVQGWFNWLGNGTKAKIEDKGRMTIGQVCAVFRSFKANNPTAKLGIIDYFQLIEVPYKNEWTMAQLSKEKSNALKALARDLDMCIIVLSQLNSAGDASEGKVLHEDSDRVEIIEHTDEGSFIRLDKNRHGNDKDEEGEAVRIPVFHDRDCVRFVQRASA